MARPNISLKRLQIDKSKANTIAVMAVCSIVVVFSLVATFALFKQYKYQAKVVSEKQKALTQLRANNQVASQLANSYESFQDPETNIIGGVKTGDGDKDGDNAKIVLDALPSKYDFPALTASIDKMLGGKSFLVSSISGTDDELNQTSPKPNSGPIEIPFQLTISGSFDALQQAIDIMQRSIRPIQLTDISLSGGGGTINAKIGAKTYYQPEKTVSITSKEVK